MSLGPFEDFAEDLAPADRRVLDAAWDSFTIERVTSAEDGAFDEAFGLLSREFGPRGEMERREVIADRLAWDPARPEDDHALLYELLLLRRRGELVAVRDHSAIVPLSSLDSSPRVVVHLSHVLVLPALRGSGIASWLRTLPVAAARRCLEGARAAKATSAASGDAQITLVAEMEHDDGSAAAQLRLRSYSHGGFRVADPSRVKYRQPDFRSAADIDADRSRPVPLCLVMRRLGREQETSIDSAELREVVVALQAMFAMHVRASDMQPVREDLDHIPAGRIELLPPAPATLH